MTLPLFHQVPRYLETLAKTHSARAVREGLLWVVPTLLLSALILLVPIVGLYVGLPRHIADEFLEIHRALQTLIPMLIAAAIAYFLSLQHRLPQVPAAFFCLSLILVATHILAKYPNLVSATAIVLAMLTPLSVVPLLARLARLKWMPGIRSGVVSDNLRDTLNILLPCLIVIVLFTLLIHVIREPLNGLLDFKFKLADNGNPYLSGMLISALNSLLWFFGVHGYHALFPVFQQLDQAVALNAIELAASGSPSHILNTSQMAAFVFIGGSGATFALALCLLFCRNRALRLLGLTSLPLALMNVNEILLFGLPIILNPRLFLPFLIAPLINVVLSLGAISLGIASPASVPLPLNSPMLFNAYWASGGQIGAVLLQLALIVVSTWIYLPFVRALDARGDGSEVIAVRSLDTTFSRLHEEASLYTYDPISHANALRRQQAEENQQIRQIAEYDFFLEYQPQVSPSNGACLACEALLRARAPSGQVRAPAEFLTWLERVGLIRDLDQWVAQAAVAQYLQWKSQGFESRISINVTGATLSDPVYRRRLLELLAPCGEGFIVEITESTLVNDADGVVAGINALRNIGVRVAIDDFGTGYSALSYLHRFPVDKIKIDRSFVLASTSTRGQLVLDGLIAFGDQLGLEIIVEGVESEEQRLALHSRNDILIQGWLYSRSLAPEAFVVFARAHQS